MTNDMPEINLISAEQKRLSLRYKAVWIALFAAGFILVIALISAVYIYSLILIQKRQINREEIRIADFKHKIADLSKIEQRQFIIYDRLDSSVKLLNSGSALQDRFDSLVGIFPADIVIENIKMNRGDESSEIGIRSDTFAGFFNIFKVLKQGGFSEVELADINRDKSGIYRVKIIIKI